MRRRRAGELADSIMSKSVTRLDYVLAKFASRIATALISFSVGHCGAGGSRAEAGCRRP